MCVQVLEGADGLAHRVESREQARDVLLPQVLLEALHRADKLRDQHVMLPRQIVHSLKREREVLERAQQVDCAADVDDKSDRADLVELIHVSVLGDLVGDEDG